MGTALTGLEIRDTYDALIKVTDNGPLDGTLQTLTDGLGNDSALALSTAGASVTGTFAVSGNSTFDTTTLVVDATNDRVGIGTGSPATPLHVANASAATVRAEGTATNGESTFQLLGKNSAGTARSAIFKYDNSDLIRIGVTQAIDMRFETNDTERMRITSAGNVGIGTSAPNLSGGASGSTILTVSATSSARNGILELNGTRTTLNDYVAYVRMFNNGAATPVADIAAIRGSSDTTGSLTLSTSNAERLRIDSSGNVGIGNSAPTAKLDVTGTLAVSGTSTFSSALTAATGSNFTGTSTNSRILVTAAGVANTVLGFNNSGSTENGVVNNAGYIGILQDYPLVVTIADAERMRITGTGNVGIGTSAPDNVLDLGQNTAGRSLTWDNQINAIATYSSGDLMLANNFYGNTASDSFLTSTTATFGAAGIRVSATGGPSTGGYVGFFADAAAAKTAGAAFTPTERMRITGAGNVGIGTSSPAELLHLATELAGSTGVGTAIQITSGGAGGDQAFIGVNKGAGNGLELSVENRDIIFNTGASTPFGGTERFRITANGVTFNGDTAAANALDDYEEGTFTPSVAFGGASAGVTYSEQAGKYTKIGRQVTVEFEIVLTSKGSSTGRVEIGNLPFTGIASQFTGAVELRNVTFTQKYAITEIGRAAGTFFRVILMDSASNSAELTDTGVANDSAFFFSATYFV